MGGIVSLEYLVDSTSVDAFMLKLDSVTSSEQIGMWLDVTVETYLHDRAKARFGGQGDDVSGAWAQLSPYTIADRLAKGYGEGPILHRTGALEQYVTTSPGEITASDVAVTLQTPMPAEDATLAVKFAVHQKGSRRNKTPARPMIGINETDVETILTSLALHIQEGLAEL